MRSILTMAVKDLTLMRRDTMGLFFIIGFPVLMSIVFGLMFGSVGSSESASLEIAVVDKDGSKISRAFVESLKNNKNITVRALAEQEALDRVRRRDLVGVVIIPKAFGETAGIFWARERPAIQIGVDPSRQAEAGLLNGLVMKATGELMAARFQDPASMRPFVKQTQKQIADNKQLSSVSRFLLGQMMGTLDQFMSSLEKVQQQSRDDGNASGVGGMQFANIQMIDVVRKPRPGSTAAVVRNIRSKWDISFPQSMMWGVLGCAAAFAITMVRERTRGTFLRLKVAPITRAHVLAGKAAACAMTVLFVIAFMVALGMLLGMRPRSPLLLMLAAVFITYCFVGVMMLMSVIGKSEEAVSGAAWGANIIMAMFGGGMIPLAFMPGFMRTIGNASPVKWAILALEGAIWRDFTLAEMIPSCAVLAAVGTVCLAVGVVVLSRARD